MKEGGRNIRKIGIVGTVGMATALVAGCSTASPAPTELPSPIVSSSGSLEPFNFRREGNDRKYVILFKSEGGERVECDFDILNINVKKNTMILRDVFCSDEEGVFNMLRLRGQEYARLSLNLGTVPNFTIHERGQEGKLIFSS